MEVGIGLFVGLVLLLFGGEFLVRGASRLAELANISSLVVGLTVVAFGTSAPELAVSVFSSWQGKGDLATGNVVGSNIFNVLFILGVCATILPLTVSPQLLRIDVPWMIAVSFLFFLLCLDGHISRWEGMLLFLLVVAYTIFLIRINQGAEVSDEGVLPEQILTTRPEFYRSFPASVLFVCVGVGMLVLGAQYIVDSAINIARYFGVSELVIGLTIVSVGTSLPEVATSIVASIRGARDIAIGNVIGSNTFNILSVLGLSALVSPEGLPVSTQLLQSDIPVMLAVAVFTWPVLFSKLEISRLEGIGFLLFYIIYVSVLVLRAMGNPLAENLSMASVYVGIPIATVLLIPGVLRTFRDRESSAL